MQLSQEYFDQALKDLSFGLEKRFHGIDQRFDAIDQRFEGVDGHLRGIYQRFDAVDEELKAMRERFDRIDVELSAIKSMVVIRQELNNLVSQLKGQGIKLDEDKIFVVPMRV